MFEKRIENLQLLEKQKNKIQKVIEIIFDSISKGNKIFFCGNGGSASDSNHLATEFISKFEKERKSISAISLCANNSTITAISNDYSFDEVFSRQIEGLAKANDVLVAISTSGKSKNVLKAVVQAKKQGLKTIFLTGENKIDVDVDVEINTSSKRTCEIQEMHIIIGHIICEEVEKRLISN